MDAPTISLRDSSDIQGQNPCVGYYDTQCTVDESPSSSTQSSLPSASSSQPTPSHTQIRSFIGLIMVAVLLVLALVIGLLWRRWQRRRKVAGDPEGNPPIKMPFEQGRLDSKRKKAPMRASLMANGTPLSFVIKIPDSAHLHN